ncbi:MAG: pyruvoyl-dependent arginine decarboxylase [Promethearchaeota archaeon]|nr:MAG: pyruvoyl-dependent arginine decarboxylase [Candidatus Lokiarchaeota archaeon]
MLKPKKFFLTKGSGTAETKLLSFEAALQDAKIASYNLVKVSSIIPPNCQEISRKEGLSYIDKGEIVYTVLAENHTSQEDKKISCALGIARSTDTELQGYVYEHNDEDSNKETTGKFAEKCAVSMVANAAGLRIKGLESILNNEELENIISESKYIAIENELAHGDKYLTVIAAVIFII